MNKAWIVLACLGSVMAAATEAVPSAKHYSPLDVHQEQVFKTLPERIAQIKQKLNKLRGLIETHQCQQMIQWLDDPLVQATINSTFPDGQTALTLAASHQSWDCFDYLVDYPYIDLNQLNDFGETPLMYLAILGQLNRVKYLVAKGVQLDNWGWNALHYAAIKSQVSVLAFLLEQGVWVDAPTPEGDTALILATQAQCTDCALHLYIAGADPQLRNAKGDSALSIAKQSKQKRLFELFQQK